MKYEHEQAILIDREPARGADLDSRSKAIRRRVCKPRVGARFAESKSVASSPAAGFGQAETLVVQHQKSFNYREEAGDTRQSNRM